MAKWLAKEFDWDTGRYTGRYYDIAEVGIVAVFVDSFYGLYTKAGTAEAPFKTLGAAITDLNSTGADGSRIFMNGIFSETLPAQTYWYEFIGCGGGWMGYTMWHHNQTLNTRIILTTTLNKIHNTITVNYAANLYSTHSRTMFFVNCYLRNTPIVGGGSYSGIVLYYSKMLNNNIGRLTFSGHSNILIGVVVTEYLDGNNLINSYFSGGNIVKTTQGCISNVEAQYINLANDDYNVRITSPLLGAGLVDQITGIAADVGGVKIGLPYNGITPEFTTEGGATITDLTIDASGKFTITSPATTGTLETALMDLGNIYPLENIDLFNVFDFAAGEITQGVFEAFSSPRMALTIKLKYGLTSSEVDDCPWLLIEYGKQPTFSGTGAIRVGNADDTFDPDTFQEITCRYMKLFITLQNNS